MALWHTQGGRCAHPETQGRGQAHRPVQRVAQAMGQAAEEGSGRLGKGESEAVLRRKEQQRGTGYGLEAGFQSGADGQQQKSLSDRRMTQESAVFEEQTTKYSTDEPKCKRGKSQFNEVTCNDKRCHSSEISFR